MLTRYDMLIVEFKRSRQEDFLWTETTCSSSEMLAVASYFSYTQESGNDPLC